MQDLKRKGIYQDYENMDFFPFLKKFSMSFLMLKKIIII